MSAADDFAALHSHPHAAAPALRIAAAAITVPGGRLGLRYRIDGDIARLRLPSPQPPGPADGLWAHTCFELFVAETGADAYREFNFSPSGQWAAYRFRAYRERDVADEALEALGDAPRVTLRSNDTTLELDAVVPSSRLPPSARSLRLGLTAVVEDTDGVLSYWALRHPGARPDFHHCDGFVLRCAREVAPRVHVWKP